MAKSFLGRRLLAAARLARWEREIEAAVGRALARRKTQVMTAGALTAAGDDFGGDEWDTDVEEEVRPVVEAIMEELAGGVVATFPLTADDAARVLGRIDASSTVDEFVRLVRGIGPDTARRIHAALAEGVGSGESIPQIAERVESVFAMAMRRATTIARTECLPANTPVDGAVVNAVFRRWYEGDLVQMRTADGREFAATPNHPMLTDRGWVPAGKLAEGDYLVCHVGHEHSGSPRDDDVETPPATIGEIFDAAAAVGVIEHRRSTGPDFHGDGRDGEVDVATPDRELRIGTFAALYKPVTDLIFAAPDLAASAFCQRCERLLSVDQQRCLCWRAQVDTVLAQNAADGSRRHADRLSDAGGGLASYVPSDDSFGVEREPVRRSPATREERSSRLGERPRSASTGYSDSNPIRPTAEYIGHSLSGQARSVKLDRLTSIVVGPFAGHVFNLSTPYGYFTANNVYTGNTNRAANAGLNAAAGEVAKELAITKTWLSASDDRVRDDHLDADGQTVAYDEAFDIGGESAMYPCDPDLSAEQSINCVLGSTLVRWPQKLRAVIRSWYEGDIFEIITSDGAVLAITPNHPVLTARGWVPAQSLEKGDKLTRAVIVEPRLQPYVDDVPPSIDEIYRTAREAWPKVGVSPARVNFHGDRPEGEVDVVRPYGQLPLDVEPCTDQLAGDDFLIGITDAERALSSLTRGQPRTNTVRSNGMRYWLDAAAAGLIRRPRQIAAALDRHLSHANNHRFTSRSDRNIECLQTANDSGSTDAEVTRHAEHAHAVRMELTDLVEINVRPFSGHVFTLETEEGWFIGNDITVRNCRCVLTFDVADESDPEAQAALEAVEAEADAG